MSKIIELKREITFPVLKIEGSFYIIVIGHNDKLVLEPCNKDGLLEDLNLTLNNKEPEKTLSPYFGWQ